MINQEIERRVEAYRGNPQALMQRYQQSQQLIDLLALQKLKSDKEAAARQMAMAMQPPEGGIPTIAQQREQEVTDMTRQEVAQQVGQVAQQRQQAQQNRMQNLMRGVAAAPGANIAAEPQAMAAGGIVAFQEGGSPLDPEAGLSMAERARRQMALKGSIYSPTFGMTPEEKAIYEREMAARQAGTQNPEFREVRTVQGDLWPYETSEMVPRTQADRSRIMEEQQRRADIQRVAQERAERLRNLQSNRAERAESAAQERSLRSASAAAEDTGSGPSRAQLIEDYYKPYLSREPMRVSESKPVAEERAAPDDFPRILDSDMAPVAAPAAASTAAPKPSSTVEQLLAQAGITAGGAAAAPAATGSGISGLPAKAPGGMTVGAAQQALEESRRAFSGQMSPEQQLSLFKARQTVEEFERMKDAFPRQSEEAKRQREARIAARERAMGEEFDPEKRRMDFLINYLLGGAGRTGIGSVLGGAGAAGMRTLGETAAAQRERVKEIEGMREAELQRSEIEAQNAFKTKTEVLGQTVKARTDLEKLTQDIAEKNKDRAATLMKTALEIAARSDISEAEQRGAMERLTKELGVRVSEGQLERIIKSAKIVSDAEIEEKKAIATEKTRRELDELRRLEARNKDRLVQLERIDDNERQAVEKNMQLSAALNKADSGGALTNEEAKMVNSHRERYAKMRKRVEDTYGPTGGAEVFSDAELRAEIERRQRTPK